MNRIVLGFVSLLTFVGCTNEVEEYNCHSTYRIEPGFTAREIEIIIHAASEVDEFVGKPTVFIDPNAMCSIAMVDSIKQMRTTDSAGARVGEIIEPLALMTHGYGIQINGPDVRSTYTEDGNREDKYEHGLMLLAMHEFMHGLGAKHIDSRIRGIMNPNASLNRWWTSADRIALEDAQQIGERGLR